MSTSGARLVTSTVSSTAPTLRSALTVAANDPARAMPSRFSVLKPEREKVTVDTPPRNCSILNCPAPSVTTVRVFSIKAGLEASTVTPGMTAPDVSRTIPAIDADACAKAPDATLKIKANATITRCNISICLLATRLVFVHTRTARLSCQLQTAGRFTVRSDMFSEDGQDAIRHAMVRPFRLRQSLE